jgi:iron complex outermembrane receptor protein
MMRQSLLARKLPIALALSVAWGGAHAQAVVVADAAAVAAPSGTAAENAAAPAASVVVTGSRASRRAVEDSMSPIQVLSSDALSHNGKPGLQEVLANSLPSVTLPSQAGGNLTSIVRVATLRGLNPDQVLILVNGKRRHISSVINVAGTVGVGAQAVDLNMIPAGAIERIEVLTDGAAAQYGSDAIAGVINVILKKSNHGGSASVQAGKYYDGDGLSKNVNLNQNFALFGDGSLSLFGNVVRQNLTNRAVDGTIASRYYAGDPREAIPQGVVYKGYGIPEGRTNTVGFNAEKPLGGDVTAYAFGTYAEATGKNWIGFRTANNDNNVTAIYPDGFVPRLLLTQRDTSVAVGVKGQDLLGWNWDLSTVYGGNHSFVNLSSSVNPTYGTASPTSFYIGGFDAKESTTNLDLSRSFANNVFAGPINVGVGLEYRRDSFAIRAGDVYSYADGGQPQLTGPKAGQDVTIPGAQGYPGYRPEDASNNARHNVGAYIDLETKLARDWTVGLAARQERYSDFGSSTSGKLSTRYEVSPTLALRGSVSNGFHAPSLGQQFYMASATSQYRGVDYNIVNLPVTSQAARLLGATDLDAEKSRNYSVGAVWTPMKNASVTVDAYQIDIDGRIVQSSNIGLSASGVLDPSLKALLNSYGIVGVDSGRYFLNGADTRTRGVDIVGTYTQRLAPGYGRINWSVGANFNDTKVTRVLDAAKQVRFGTQVFSQVNQDYLSETTPKNKVVLTADWSSGKWRFMVRETRYGSFVTPSTVAGAYSYQGNKYLTDLEASYYFTDNLHVTVGAQNAFDRYPDRANSKNFNPATFNGAQYYNSASPFGLSGGNYYATLNYAWD